MRKKDYPGNVPVVSLPHSPSPASTIDLLYYISSQYENQYWFIITKIMYYALANIKTIIHIKFNFINGGLTPEVRTPPLTPTLN